MNKLKIYKYNFFEGESFVLRKMHIKKGMNYPLHWHNYFEFEIILEGEGEHIYNNHKYDVLPGDAYLMSYYDFHALTAKRDITLLSLHFAESAVANELSLFMAQHSGSLCCRFDCAEANKITTLLYDTDLEKKNKGIYSDIAAKSLVSIIIISLMRKCGAEPPRHTPDLILHAVGYMRSCFKKDISLTDVARECSVTPNYMGAMIQKWTGLSFSEYLNSIRLKYACDILKASDLSVKETAFMSGYNSVEYFSYIFRKKIGTTPLRYRRESGDRQHAPSKSC